jgi:raffinose/stachyose/melibiose transport system permease protein
MAENVRTLRRRPKRAVGWWAYLVAVLLVLFYLLPIYIMLNQSFRTVQDIGSKLTLPTQWNFDNYTQVLESGDLWLGFKNSLIIVAITAVVEIFFSALGAYGLARGGGRLARSISDINMGIMMVPGVALLVGTYSLMAKLQMTNSLTGLALLTAAGGIPGTMFMYTNFVASIPRALDEAAEIDGAGVMRTFFQIVMPQLKAVTVTRVIMTATGCWNNYLMPMYLLQNKAKFTIILIIKTAFNRSNGLGNLPKACATCVLGLLPIIILYVALQKYIIEGQIDSSVK